MNRIMTCEKMSMQNEKYSGDGNDFSPLEISSYTKYPRLTMPMKNVPMVNRIWKHSEINMYRRDNWEEATNLNCIALVNYLNGIH